MTIKSRRRSTMSASAPAGSASSISGKLSAASTSATIDGDDESDVISQPAPTSCIQVPMFETMVAIQRLRKSAILSGLHAECSGRASAASPEPAVVMGYLRAARSGIRRRQPRGGPSRSWAQRPFHGFEERRHAERYVLDLTIDEQRRGAANAALAA